MTCHLIDKMYRGSVMLEELAHPCILGTEHLETWRPLLLSGPTIPSSRTSRRRQPGGGNWKGNHDPKRKDKANNSADVTLSKAGTCSRVKKHATGFCYERRPLMEVISAARAWVQILLELSRLSQHTYELSLLDGMGRTPYMHKRQRLQSDSCMMAQPAHFFRNEREHLTLTFQDRWNDLGGPTPWPVRSSNLNPLDFWLSRTTRSISKSACMIPYAEGQRNALPYKNSIKHTTMRELLFQIFAPGIPLPPQPVLTRWGTWLDAVNYYAEHYGKIMEHSPTPAADARREFDPGTSEVACSKHVYAANLLVDSQWFGIASTLMVSAIDLERSQC
ncbi:hypothetical protein ANN_13250 [Periplaneta americana]|uniref:Uncharacterized protein n=1 Tax=Periplaneta americana TaxID=6978 RepID=A0ABQ8TL42_PERAM|nr:hypothetical protein ANN_13250 [Periplaneta americana]